MAAYTSWGQRKALGRRYGTDPAQISEQQRIAQEYALQPERERLAFMRAESERQQRNLEDAQKQAEIAGMVGTAGNVATTAATLRAMTKGEGEPFFGKWGKTAQKTPSAFTTQPFTPEASLTPAAPSAAAGLGAAGAAGLAGAAGIGAGLTVANTPYAAIGTAASSAAGAFKAAPFLVNPALVDAGMAGGAAAAGGAGAAAGGAASSVMAGAGVVGAVMAASALLSPIVGDKTFLGKVVSFPAKVGKAITDPITKALGCIIITACTQDESDEVNIAREYRDKFLTQDQLRGYYVIAEKVVPLCRFKAVKWLVKRFLVDNLITYGKYVLRCEAAPGWLARHVTESFLALCGKVGSKRESFTRINGEVY